jgi:hypothetical protein
VSALVASEGAEGARSVSRSLTTRRASGRGSATRVEEARDGGGGREDADTARVMRDEEGSASGTGGVETGVARLLSTACSATGAGVGSGSGAEERASSLSNSKSSP